MTFLIDNDISLRPSKGEIKIWNKYVIFQTNTMMLPPQIKTMESSSKIVKLKKCRIHMTGTMTNPMKEIFRL